MKFPEGFPANMNDLFSKVQEMQQNMSKTQADLEKQEVEASAGGGMVCVKVNGAQLLTSLKIDKAVVNPEDVEMLEDLVRAAVNEGVRKSRELMKAELLKATGGIPIPGFN